MNIVRKCKELPLLLKVAIIMIIIFGIYFIKELSKPYCENGTLVENECISCPEGYILNIIDKKCTKIFHEEKKEITLTDFSSLNKEEISSWCKENKILCSIKDEYSDTIPKNNFISQSIEKNQIINEGDKVNIVFSLGKEPTKGQKNALKSAKSYLRYSSFSYEGLIHQLEFEEYSHEEAVYAVDNCGADWNEQAVKMAKSYLAHSSFSRFGLIKQLEFEKFTHEQAVYGVEQNGY